MEAAFCVETLNDALARGKPDVFNTDQGAQFTRRAFTGAPASNGIAIGMDGKGAWRDNVFIERLWRSQPQSEVAYCAGPRYAIEATWHLAGSMSETTRARVNAHCIFH